MQIVGFVYGKPNRYPSGIVPSDFMVFYRGGVGAATVFGGGRGWEMPFYVGCATGEGDVVEVDYLPPSAS